MLAETTVTTFTVTCDGPASCPTRPLVTPTEAGLARILKGQGWRLSEADGKIDRTQPTYCKRCTMALQADGKLGA
jgi:hypothetical protein